MNAYVSLRCNWCSKYYHAHDVMALASGQLLCRKCFEKNAETLRAIAGEGLPKACHLCEIHWSLISGFSHQATQRAYVVPIDGLQAFVCHDCMLAYCAKRSDIYGGTKFGQELKL